MSATAETEFHDDTAVVVFGRSETGKARASAFGHSEAELARNAAELMDLRLLPVRTDAERALAAKLPRGRVFATGRAFVPFVKDVLLTELQAAALNSGVKPLKLLTGPAASGAAEPTPAARATAARSAKSYCNGTGGVKQPCGWADVRVGSIVLGAAPPRRTEWYECLVIAVEGEDVFVLRYCDWPKEPPFKRRRVEIGLMHPAYTPEPPLEPELPLWVA
jgi:hypothetical protein